MVKKFPRTLIIWALLLLSVAAVPFHGSGVSLTGPVLESSVQESDFDLGLKAFNKGDFELAAFYFSRHLTKSPNDEMALYNRGLAHSRLQKFDLALADFSRAIQINPKHWQAYSSRGYVYLTQKRCDLAIPELATAISINPNDGISYQNRGFCYQQNGNPSLAQADFAEAEAIKSGRTKNPPQGSAPTATNASEEFQLGLKTLDAKNYQQAVLHYTRYIAAMPNDTSGYYNRGLAYNSLMQPDLAITDFNRVLEINPRNAGAYINRGYTYFGQGKTELAIRDYTSAIQLEPNNKLPLKNRGLAYKAIGKNDLAEADFARVAQLESGTNTSAGTGRTKDLPGSGAVSWMPVVEMDKQIFPSYFLATATMPAVESQVPGVIGDAQGMIGAHIINPKANTRLKLVYEIDSIVKQQEFEATLKEAGKYYQIYPRIVWNWDALKRFKKASPANATFSLYLDGQLIEKKTLVVRIRSLNESVYAYSYLVDENRWANTGWLFAAYVNEDHEWIDQILKEALNTRVVDAFIGYQGNQDKVISQVFAIWYVLQRRGFRYSSITNTSGSGTTQKVFSQYVRLFEESINASQANCVDGTVLIASILKKIGIRVGLVLVPGHCFLVFDLDGKGNWRGLETTMMGNVDLARFPDEKSKVEASIKGFLDAITAGNKTFGESLVKIGEKHPQYKLVDVDQSRKAGVFPIAW